MPVVFPQRTPWSSEFPAIAVHTAVRIRDAHPDYNPAKSGDVDASERLVAALANPLAIESFRLSIGNSLPFLTPVRALERSGLNEIPDALSWLLSDRLNLEVHQGIVQINQVNHTRAGGAERFLRPALFDGPVIAGKSYVIVDDHVGLGGTVANLKGFIELRGGSVLAVAALTVSRNSDTIALQEETLQKLRFRHGELEDWWSGRFGYGFDCLTEPEAGFLYRIPDARSLRDRFLA
jgi:hypothetical protein